jgi:hypothetical protein
VIEGSTIRGIYEVNFGYLEVVQNAFRCDERGQDDEPDISSLG